jgi:hypothetical protein
MDDLSSVILSELRALRDDFNEHTRNTTERLTKLETQMYAIVGNGVRLGQAEEDIESLKQWRWRMAGITTAVSTVISVLAWFIKH